MAGEPPQPRCREPTATTAWKDTILTRELPPAGFWYPSNASDHNQKELCPPTAQGRSGSSPRQGRGRRLGERAGVSTRCAISFLPRSSKRDNHYVDWQVVWFFFFN